MGGDGSPMRPYVYTTSIKQENIVNSVPVHGAADAYILELWRNDDAFDAAGNTPARFVRSHYLKRANNSGGFSSTIASSLEQLEKDL